MAWGLGPAVEATRAGDVLISQVFPASSGTAAYNRDYVELKNRGTAPVNIAGWRLHYGSPTTTLWTRIALPSVTLQPGQHLLISMGLTSAGGTPLPSPDLLWNNTPMDPSGGRLALTRSDVIFTIGCPLTSPVLEDFVGYGSAACARNLPAPAPSATQAVLRVGDGCVDTHSNIDDFALGTPIARTMASAAAPCTPPTRTLTVQFAGFGAGEVISDPAGVWCAQACQTAWPTGTLVTLAAAPGFTSRLDGWDGAGEGFDARVVELDVDAVVTVRFACMADVTGAGGPPEPADGLLTLDDILAFVDSYNEGCVQSAAPCALADITGLGGRPTPPDGQLTLDDILDFVNGYMDDCPP